MSRKPAKTQHASTTKPKRNNAPTATRPASSTLADLQEQIGALTRELAEALERQTATSEVLRVISSSPGDLQPVFEAMLENAVRICGAKFGNLLLIEGDGLRNVALHNAPAKYLEARQRESFFRLFKHGIHAFEDLTHFPVEIAGKGLSRVIHDGELPGEPYDLAALSDHRLRVAALLGTFAFDEVLGLQWENKSKQRGPDQASENA
jgi:hypothetical protein